VIQSACKAIEFGEKCKIRAITAFKVIQGPISYRFGVIAAYYSNFGHFAFLSPPLEGLRTTYDVHLGNIGKRVVDFLLVLIELFSVGVAAEALRAKIDRKSAISLQRGQYDPKFQVEGVGPTNHFLHGWLGQ